MMREAMVTPVLPPPSGDEDAVGQLAAELPAPEPEQQSEWAPDEMEESPAPAPAPVRRPLAVATRTIMPDAVERDVADILAEFPDWLRRAREYRNVLPIPPPPEGLAPVLVQKLEIHREKMAEEQQVRIRLAEVTEAHAQAVTNVLPSAVLLSRSRTRSLNKTVALCCSGPMDARSSIRTYSVCMRTRISKRNSRRTNGAWPYSRFSCVSITIRLPSLSSSMRRVALALACAAGACFTVALVRKLCPLTSAARTARCTSSAAFVASG
jgi:hypothetical protein